MIHFFISFQSVFNNDEVVILILKHATILRLSKSPEDALTLAEQDYKEAKIDSKIQEHVKAFTLEDSIEQFADFIMATNIGLFMHSFITTISHLSLTQNSCIEKTIGVNSFGGQFVC